MKFREIDLREIDLGDDTFRIRPGGVDVGLLRSIERVGVVNPPWLRRRAGRKIYQVIMGFRRISALRELGREVVMARVVSEKDYDDVRLMEAVILENLTHGPLNPVEISRGLVRLKRMGLHDEEIRDRYLPAMGLKGDLATLDRYLTLDALSGDVTEAVAGGEIRMATVERVIGRFKKRESERILGLVRDLKLGVNRQRELVILLEEILRRDEVDLAELLGRKEISAVLRSEKLNTPQKACALISALRKIRSPQVVEMMDRVKTRVRRLGLDPAVTLGLSPYLEERMMRVSFGFRTREEYRKVMNSLISIGEGDMLPELLQDLFGRSESERDDGTG